MPILALLPTLFNYEKTRLIYLKHRKSMLFISEERDEISAVTATFSKTEGSGTCLNLELENR